MRPATVAPLATAVLGLPAALLDVLPPWALLTLVGISALLTPAAQVVVTQIIRLRASTSGEDALRVLELEANTRRRGRPK